MVEIKRNVKWAFVPHSDDCITNDFLSGNENLDVVCFSTFATLYILYTYMYPFLGGLYSLRLRFFWSKILHNIAIFYHLKLCIIPFLIWLLKTSHSPLILGSCPLPLPQICVAVFPFVRNGCPDVPITLKIKRFILRGHLSQSTVSSK